MTVLDSVLIEEYERKERMKKAFQEELAHPDCKNREKLEQGLKDIEFDQKKIRAALDVAGIDIEKVFKE